MDSSSRPDLVATINSQEGFNNKEENKSRQTDCATCSVNFKFKEQCMSLILPQATSQQKEVAANFEHNID
jgi:hypothetical protein